MKEFIIGEGSNGFTMNLPTKLSEITEDYLLNVTKNVVIADYHAIVAVVYRAKLPFIISTAKKKRDLAASIVPIFVRSNPGSEDNIYKDINCGDKLIIAGTDIERGYHIVCPKNFITIDNIIRIYNSDNNFAKGVMTDQNDYYFVDFKLVPVTDIKGFYKTNVDNTFINPFIIDNKENKGN